MTKQIRVDSGVKLTKGLPTNTMSKGNPIPYVSSDSADPVKVEFNIDDISYIKTDGSNDIQAEGVLPEPIVYGKKRVTDTLNENVDNISISAVSDVKSNVSSSLNDIKTNALTAVGSGVVIANFVSNAADIPNAVGAITAAFTGKVAERAGNIIGEYTAKYAALPASVPGRISKYTQEALSKTKGDVDSLGAQFPTKLSLTDALIELLKPKELMASNEFESIANNQKNSAISKVQEKLKGVSESVNKVLEKTNGTIAKIMSHAEEGPTWLQQNIDREMNRIESNIRKELDTGYKAAEKEINTFCENAGNKAATNIISIYNKTIRENAQVIINKQNEAKQKAMIKMNAAKQIAILKLYALLGV